MAAEEVILNGDKVTTLRELLRPGLKAVSLAHDMSGWISK
jgi:hypothetical protein